MLKGAVRMGSKGTCGCLPRQGGNCWPAAVSNSEFKGWCSRESSSSSTASDPDLNDLSLRESTSLSESTVSDPVELQESCEGPWGWNARRSAELQRVVDQFCIDGLYDQTFSLTVADPLQPECPMVACSIGFTELTGYTVGEIVGRNCKFLLDGVPPELINAEARRQCRLFCQAAARGEEYCADANTLSVESAKPSLRLPLGEMICVQTNARKSGELFQSMFYLKQVELDDAKFVLGLQVGLPEDIGVEFSMEEFSKRCQLALARLEQNMSMVEEVLAQQFMYSAPMRRQTKQI